MPQSERRATLDSIDRRADVVLGYLAGEDTMDPRASFLSLLGDLQRALDTVAGTRAANRQCLEANNDWRIENEALRSQREAALRIYAGAGGTRTAWLMAVALGLQEASDGTPTERSS